MSAEAKKPEDPVHDGVQGGSDPIAKEPDGSREVRTRTSANGPGKAPGNSRGASDSDTDDPSGPAEEQDNASPDDRGLTTDLAPSD
ncbi:hypothetical protein [Arthrobacter sp. AZCC_0090]|uniref:hypothetical protein n=1 Tax=Arthrobacter sp. AZCC_0090 TaxID=2735881 RepID=UPI001609C1EE|nr:hypothetical protein [Arthrobacter sp. AZCC_0090]MBB6404048.1 hypothetical protein [Arthrobacter sp. AZCC_0090]